MKIALNSHLDEAQVQLALKLRAIKHARDKGYFQNADDHDIVARMQVHYDVDVANPAGPRVVSASFVWED